ncbi:MAG: proline--tRNA ligase [Spirochaetaceae bacterium]|nr:MAG: proline--tRNA ligase [Spirochaetaceae bacterium]
MRYSQLFGKTLRQVPHGVRSESYQLLVRGGFVRPLGQGLFCWLPLGQRIIAGIQAIIREEMEALGGQEVVLPLVNPHEIWRRSGRDRMVGRDMIHFTDRHGKRLVLSPTHEEAMLELVRSTISSYRELPIFLYQFQSKFRDEERMRCGPVRSKEFLMKDAYSFHRSFVDLNNFFPRVFAAYQRIFARCGVPVMAAEAGVGYMGGERSFEFLFESECGDDKVTVCPKCGYTANTEVAVGSRKSIVSSPLEMERVRTPGCTSMARLATCLKLPRTQLGKAMIYATAHGLVMALVRADHQVSLEKLGQVLHDTVLRLATGEQLDAAELVAGYFSPLGLSAAERRRRGIRIVVDEIAADTPNLVLGANEPDYHYRNTNFGRDYDADLVADIARIAPGSGCLHCGGLLEERVAMELGHIFRLGDFYTRAMGYQLAGEHRERIYPHMGSYGIGIGRLIAAVVEHNRDDRGIIWPAELAPYQFYVLSIGKSSRVRAIVNEVYRKLGPLALLDDRFESISTKFKDADLLGIPMRIVISVRSVQKGELEILDRRTRKVIRLPLDEVRHLGEGGGRRGLRKGKALHET